MSGSGCEVERVYLLDRMPEIHGEAEVWQIEQGYLVPHGVDDTQQNLAEGRIRRVQLPDGRVQYVHTIKRGMGLVREEREHEISEAEFQELWPATEGRRIRKERTRVSEGPLIWELDRFIGIDLVLAEVELPDPETPVEPPDWLQPRVIREVTEEPEYRNFELARSSGLLGGGGESGGQ